MTTTRRRWFRFSLRAMFVAVTVTACWLAREIAPIQERRGIIAMLQVKGSLHTAPTNLMYPGPEQSTVRWFLFDVPPVKYFFLIKKVGFTNDELQRIKRAFPEATVEVVDHDWDGSSMEHWPTAAENWRYAEKEAATVWRPSSKISSSRREPATQVDPAE